MNGEVDRWRRVRSLFQAMLERPESERARFLREVCPHDSDLQREVESLLSAHHAAPSQFMHRPAVDDMMLSAAERLGDASREPIDSRKFDRASALQIETGSWLGTYQMGERLGEGGMGIVYRARDSRLNRDVALKILPPEFAVDSDRLRRFEREAQAIASLNHPNIVTIYSVETVDGLRFFTMELVDGRTLATAITRGGLKVSEILTMAIPLADAVSAAHQRGITHRDLKPTNVLITRDARLKVLDFGLAKLGEMSATDAGVSVPSRVGSTAEGRLIGTVAYMSPEQAEGKPVDHRSDIFSLGVILYELATGKRPFTGETSVSVLSSIVEDTPRRVTALNPSMPGEFARIVRHCLAKEPARRYQTAADLRNELEELHLDLSTPQALGVETPPPLLSKFTIMPILRGLIVTVVLALFAAFALARFRSIPEAGPLVRLSLNAPEHWTLAHRAAPVSPDGRYIVFVANDSSGQSALWLRTLSTDAAALLPGTANADIPFWAPDSRSVGFTADGKMQRITVSGGRPQIVCDTGALWGATWNRDGTIVFAPASRSGLFKVPAAGGRPTPVTELSAARKEGSHRWPYFLPDGRHFLYLAIFGSEIDTGLYVASLDSAETHRVRSGYSAFFYATPGYLLFVDQSTLMAQRFDESRLQVLGDPVVIAPDISIRSSADAPFAASDAGVLTYQTVDLHTQLVWVDRSGHTLEMVYPPAWVADPAVARRSSRVLFARREERTSNVDLWLADSARGTLSRLTSDPSQDVEALWSPDEMRFAFRSNRNGPGDLYVATLEGRDNEQAVLISGERKDVTAWSPDGRFLMYDNWTSSSNRDIWVLPLFGTRQPMPYIATRFDEWGASLSPDGRWVAYASNESGRFEVYLQGFPATGEKWPVSIDGGREPAWRGDGRELYFLSSVGQLMAVHVNYQDHPPSIGKPTPLFRLRTNPGYLRNAYDISADGKRFLINEAIQDQSAPMTVVLNWTAALAK